MRPTRMEISDKEEGLVATDVISDRGFYYVCQQVNTAGTNMLRDESTYCFVCYPTCQWCCKGIYRSNYKKY